MKRHIIRDRLDVVDILKKLTTTMPMEYFKPYFQNTIYGLNKVLGMDGTINSQEGVYIMALDIQDIHTNVEYDFFTHMTYMIHNEIIGAQIGECRILSSISTPSLCISFSYTKRSMLAFNLLKLQNNLECHYQCSFGPTIGTISSTILILFFSIMNLFLLL